MTANPQSKIYGAVDPKLDYAVSGLINNDKETTVLSGSLSRALGEDVGTYAITQGDLKATGNYSLSFIGADLVITPALLTVSPTTQSKVYGAADPALDYKVSGLVNNDKETAVLSGSLSRALGEDVGSYAITQGDLKANGNYSLSFIGADLVITPALLTVSATTQSKVYGAVEPKLDYTVSGLVNNDKETDVLSGSLSRALGEDVGSYAITQGDLKANGNYSLSFIGANLTITPAVLTVSTNPQSKVYGAVEPKLDYAVSGLVNNDKETAVLSGSLSRKVGEDVGTYAITQGMLIANSNYVLSFIGADLTITPAVLTVTATLQSKVYGAVDSKLDYTISGLVNNDKETAVLSGSLSRAVGEDVGSYAITQGDLKANGNYTLVFKGANLTIGKAPLTVTANAQSKVYGAVDPKLDYTVSGLVNNDKETDVLSGSLFRKVGEDVGTYAITQGTLIANSNYVLSFTGADLNITPAVLIVSATAQSKVYGVVDPKLGYTVSGLIEGDLLSGSLSRAVGEDVGTYAINQGDLKANGNYALSFAGANLTIDKASLTVTVNPQSKIYGAVDPSLNYTVSGLVNNDKETAVLSGSLSRVAGEDVGTYSITQGDLKASGNYTLDFKGASLEVTPAVLIVTVNTKSKVYGDADPSLNYTVSGLVNNDKETDVLSGSLSREVGENVDNYAITQGTLIANSNYSLSFIGANLTIGKAPLTVTANAQSKVYGAVDPKLDYTVLGLVNNDKETDVLSGSLFRKVGEDVGSYAITQSDLKANGNYTLVFKGANLTIGKAPLTVTANPQSKVYGAVNPKFDYTVSGLQFIDKETAVLSGSLSRAVGEDVGSYAITQGDLKANGNYILDFKGASLEITPAVLTVTANPQSKVYGAADPALDYTVSGLQFIDKETAVLSDSLSRAVGEDVGTYAITQGDLKASGNYTLDFKGASLEITPAVLTVTVNTKSKVYGAADPKLDYTISGLVNNDKEIDVLSGSLSRALGEGVGSYVITQGDLKANGNYTVDFIRANLTIEKAPIIGMVLKGGTYVYDTKEKSVLLSSTLPIGTKVTYKNNKQTEAGEYEVTALIEGDNYIPLLLKTKLIINKAPQHIEFNALSPVLYDNLLQLQLIANSSVDLPINYTYMNVGTTVAATVTSTGLVKVLHPGSVIITAHQDGNNNYEPAQSVSQILVIKSDKAEINSLIINGRDIGELSSNKLFMLRCDEIDKQVEVELVTSEGASVNIGNHFFIDTPKAGIYNREIVVKSHSGTITNRYILSIERPFNFEDIVIQKFDNTLLVNNNPLTNGGYRFVGYKWFKNGKLIGNEQVYSVGNHRDDLLDIDALYSLELTTDKGEIIHSCPAMIKYTHTNSIKLYPNPVVKNGVMEIALDYPESSLKNITGSVYSLTGQFLFKVSLENKISEVILPNTLVEGVYLMIIKIEGQNKVFRFMVKP
ncbi:bacterial surface protein 26-residue [Myroides profundi]|nr:bacterial surface protein 26-residue [Myroides profundi]